MSYRRMFFWTTYKHERDDMSYWRTYFTGEHVFLKDMSYWKTCLIGIHVGIYVLLVNMYYWIK